MEDYKELVECLANNKDFYDAVQEIVNRTVSDECVKEFERWRNLRDEYASLIEEIREIKEETKKVYCGSGLRYKIAHWLIK